MGKTCTSSEEAFQKECRVKLPGLINPEFKLKAKYMQIPMSFGAYWSMKKEETEFTEAFKFKAPEITMHDARSLQE